MTDWMEATDIYPEEMHVTRGQEEVGVLGTPIGAWARWDVNLGDYDGVMLSPGDTVCIQPTPGWTGAARQQYGGKVAKVTEVDVFLRPDNGVVGKGIVRIGTDEPKTAPVRLRRRTLQFFTNDPLESLDE